MSHSAEESFKILDPDPETDSRPHMTYIVLVGR